MLKNKGKVAKESDCKSEEVVLDSQSGRGGAEYVFRGRREGRGTIKQEQGRGRGVRTGWQRRAEGNKVPGGSSEGNMRASLGADGAVGELLYKCNAWREC